ncbi:MAG: adenosylcobinamide-phosphate synthase CbiB [Oscillospiraceae bacterium]
MSHLAALLLGFLLDLLFADPPWLPHPVVAMGRAITGLEGVLRRLFPETPRGELLAGGVLAAVLPLGVLGLSAGILGLCGAVHPALRFCVEALWCGQAIALRGLGMESRNVYRCLTEESLEAARTAVARIVGRDTAQLTAEAVTKAAVETVAENFADGVVAPLLFLALGGAPLGLAYKAINTMDSMVGYKNDRYLYFGRAAARLDDAAGFFPARLAALLLMLSAGLTGQSVSGAYGIWKRDRHNHASPNSAQTEAAMAGALGVRLAGPAFYFGQLCDKPTIGDPLRPIVPGDILLANRLLYWGGLLCLLPVGGLLLFK